MSFFKKLSSEYISNHQYFTARKDAYETENGKTIEPYFVVELPMSACAVAFTTDDKLVLVKQFRYPINKICVELPGGFVDNNEPKEKAIARELLEETGYSFEKIIHLGDTYANPGVLNNMTHLFLCTGGIKTAEQSLDENEEIEILLKSKEEVLQMIKEGEIVQAMHELCLYKGFDYIRK
jgi:ADP-ribose pyrophosphatase